MIDVAREAGVSAMTVSNVINGRPGVSAETRLRVLATISRLDRPSLAAYRLPSQFLRAYLAWSSALV
jgi:DNA-binding LacI/PurR family transcriptional regulator